MWTPRCFDKRNGEKWTIRVTRARRRQATQKNQCVPIKRALGDFCCIAIFKLIFADFICMEWMSFGLWTSESVWIACIVREHNSRLAAIWNLVFILLKFLGLSPALSCSFAHSQSHAGLSEFCLICLIFDFDEKYCATATDAAAVSNFCLQFCNCYGLLCEYKMWIFIFFFVGE